MSEAPVNYTPSTFESKTVAELIAHALKEFNVAIEPDSMNKQKLVGYLLALQDLRSDGIELDKGAADGAPHNPEIDPKLDAKIAAEVQNAEVSETMRQSRERRVRVVFHSANEPGGNLPIKMSLNGIAYVAWRDKEVALPESVFNACIVNAVQTIYEPITDPVTRITTVSQARDVGRFAYNVLGYKDGSKAA